MEDIKNKTGIFAFFLRREIKDIMLSNDYNSTKQCLISSHYLLGKRNES